MTYTLKMTIKGVVGFVQRSEGGRTLVDLILPDTLLGDHRAGHRRVWNPKGADRKSVLVRHAPRLEMSRMGRSPRGHRIELDFPTPAPTHGVTVDSSVGTLPHMSNVVGPLCGLAARFDPSSNQPHKYLGIHDPRSGNAGGGALQARHAWTQRLGDCRCGVLYRVRQPSGSAGPLDGFAGVDGPGHRGEPPDAGHVRGPACGLAEKATPQEFDDRTGRRDVAHEPPSGPFARRTSPRARTGRGLRLVLRDAGGERAIRNRGSPGPAGRVPSRSCDEVGLDRVGEGDHLPLQTLPILLRLAPSARAAHIAALVVSAHGRGRDEPTEAAPSSFGTEPGDPRHPRVARPPPPHRPGFGADGPRRRHVEGATHRPSVTPTSRATGRTRR